MEAYRLEVLESYRLLYGSKAILTHDSGENVVKSEANKLTSILGPFFGPCIMMYLDPDGTCQHDAGLDL